MKYIIFAGGFHNSGPIRIRVSEEQQTAIREKSAPLYEILSENQMKRLNRHFCGVSGCRCGGVTRSEIIDGDR